MYVCVCVWTYVHVCYVLCVYMCVMYCECTCVLCIVSVQVCYEHVLCLYMSTFIICFSIYANKTFSTQ